MPARTCFGKVMRGFDEAVFINLTNLRKMLIISGSASFFLYKNRASDNFTQEMRKDRLVCGQMEKADHQQISVLENRRILLWNAIMN